MTLRKGIHVLLAGVIAFLIQEVVPGAEEELLEEGSGRGNVVTPKTVKPTAALIAGLKVPQGFVVAKFAEGLGKPRMMAVGGDGVVFITRREPGDVVTLADTNGDGVADSQSVVVKDLEGVHGITIHAGKLFLCTVNDLYVCEMAGGVSAPKKLMGKLPRGGRHPNRTLGVGPDSQLYITIGSTCNACVEESPESAAILRAPLDGNTRTVFARGLRNTLGFGWHPVTNKMWGMDHGSDWLGDDTPVEELNLLEAGKDYGWPFVYNDRKTIPLESHPAVGKLSDYAAKTTSPVLGYQAHAAPLQMVFYTGTQFPREYRNDAFIAMHGSWNRKPATGYEVVRIKFDPEGQPKEFEKFMTGFLIEGPAYFGRPAGVAMARDGALLIGDDINGVIYRVSYPQKPAVTGE